ncbi:MAG: LuxR C-terminal-related transcriptional regulator [Aliarcobacter sp.]|nr:LuxR C-terminal-related transcriptional regulator [Aliarcobacter sp.]
MKIIVYSKDLNLIDRYKKLLNSYSFIVISEYENLYFEAKKESVIIIMNIEECEDDFSLLSSLIEQNAYLMILDSTPNYEKGKQLIFLGIKCYGNLMMDDIHLKEAISSVSDGNVWLYPEFINETVQRMRYEANPNAIDEKLKSLSNREKEVAMLVLKKLSYLEISEQLDITIRTVKAHTKNIYEKFNVSNRLAFLLLFNH